MGEKRDYSRYTLRIPCILVKDGMEFSCIVNDISERGISFLFDRERKLIPDFEKETDLSFQFIDSFSLGNKLIERPVISKGIIKNRRRIRDGFVYGCYVYDRDYMKYVEKRKVASFIEYLHRSG